MKNNLFQIFSNLELCSNFDTYTFIGNLLCPNNLRNAKKIISDLSRREKTGNIQIDERVVLPHLESKLIAETTVIIIQSAQLIKTWNEEIKEIDLIVAAMLSSGEYDGPKKRITLFMRKLAEKEFLDKLRKIMRTEDLLL